MAALEKRMLTGRQKSPGCCSGTAKSLKPRAVLEFQDLLAVELKGENIRALVTDWEMCLAGMKDCHVPAPAVMESHFRRQLEKSEALRETLALYNLDITQEGASPSYDTLMSMVKSHLEFKRRQRNRDEFSSRGSRGRGAAARKAER